MVHAEIRIGDSVVFVTDEGEENGSAPSSVGGKVTAVMALNVPDVDDGLEPGDRRRVRGDLRRSTTTSTATAVGESETRSATSG